MKTFIINRATWRCGGYSTLEGCYLGTGITLLENEEGYMCCLGQILKQEGFKVLNLANPGFAANENQKETFLAEFMMRAYYSNYLAEQAMRINDDEKTTVANKEDKLTKLFEENGYKLEFQ